jgi:hypothetical protein
MLMICFISSYREPVGSQTRKETRPTVVHNRDHEEVVSFFEVVSEPVAFALYNPSDVSWRREGIACFKGNYCS